MGTWCTLGVERQIKERELKESYAELREERFILLNEIKSLKKQVKHWKRKAEGVNK